MPSYSLPVHLPINHTVFADVTDITDNGIGASDYYDTWCTELGVSNLDTDYFIADNDPSAHIIPVGESFYADYGAINSIVFSDEKLISFYQNDPTGSPYITVTTFDGDVFNILGTPYPNLSISLDLSGTDNTTANNSNDISNFKIKKSGNVTIIYFDYKFNKTGILTYTSNAVKIENGIIKFIVNVSGLHTSGSAAKFSIIEYFDELNLGDLIYSDLGSPDYPTIYEINIYKQSYKINGIINNNININKFKAVIHNLKNGYKIKEQLVNTIVNDTFIEYLFNDKPVSLTIQVDATAWEPNTTIAVGDIIYPTDPVTTPYYYRCTVPGTTGTTEPTWPTSAGTVTDGNVTWEFADQMIQPVTHAPIIPRLV